MPLELSTYSVLTLHISTVSIYRIITTITTTTMPHKLSDYSDSNSTSTVSSSDRIPGAEVSGTFVTLLPLIIVLDDDLKASNLLHYLSTIHYS